VTNSQIKSNSGNFGEKVEGRGKSKKKEKTLRENNAKLCR
jgi:hypothetical protein